MPKRTKPAYAVAGDPAELLRLAEEYRTSEGQAGRRLTRRERITVMAHLRAEGRSLSTRQAARLFSVSHAQIVKDMPEVWLLLDEYWKDAFPSWERTVSDWRTQHERVRRNLWDQYERASRAGDRPTALAVILDTIDRAEDRYIDRLQELGVLPRAARAFRGEFVGFLEVPRAREVAAKILEAAAKRMSPEDLKGFRLELVEAFGGGQQAEATIPSNLDDIAKKKQLPP